MNTLTATRDLEINLLPGCVEYLEGKHRVQKNFTWALVRGNTDQEIRANFRYSETFIGRAGMKLRQTFRDMEDKGMVRLVSFKVEKKLGRSFV